MPSCTYGDVVEPCSWTQKYVLPIYEGLDQSALATVVKDSLWMVPWAGALHLLALGVLGGAILLVDMRVLGAGLASQTPAALMRSLRPFLIAAVGVMVFSGSVLALGELMKLFYSPPYWVKMAALAAALLFTFGVRDGLIARDGQLGGIGWALAAAALILWLSVFTALSNWLARAALATLGVGLALFWILGARAAAKAGVAAVAPIVKAASALSIALWLTVAASGRWIAFW